MTGQKTIFISLACALIALFLFAYMREWIIFRTPHIHTAQEHTQHLSKQQVTLWFFQNNRWQHEQKEILTSTDATIMLTHLINALLVLFEEEKLLEKKVILQSVALSPDGLIAYISFDRPPLAKQTSIYTKWMNIEAILRTVRENGSKLQKIHFLTHHQPMQDMHIDFSNSWPVGGFQ